MLLERELLELLNRGGVLDEVIAVHLEQVQQTKQHAYFHDL